MPQAIRYSPTAVSGTPLAKNATKAQNEIQNAPYELKAVAPKVLPFLNSHMPASNCAPPPYASASPRTTGSPALSTSPALNMLSTKVVRAKPASPKGAGSAIEVPTTSTSSAMGVPPCAHDMRGIRLSADRALLAGYGQECALLFVSGERLPCSAPFP